VKYAAMEALQVADGPSGLDWLISSIGPVSVTVMFRLPRPKGHYGTGRNAGYLRASAPRLPGGRPDIDKLLRSTFDALGEAGVWGDDSQVTDVHASKMYANPYEPIGATIRVSGVEQVES